MSTGKKITAEMLEAKGAGCGAVDIFREEWPNGAFVTLKNIKRAQELELDISWFAFNFLEAQAWEAFDKATAPAWEAYDKTTAQAREAFDKATAPAWEAYDKTTAQALKAYDKATAQTLHNAWREQCQSTRT